MVTRAEWYTRVNAAWPERVPPLTADEATRAARKLYRFVMKKTWTGPVRVTSGNRKTWVEGGAILVNPEKGWKDMVHLLSHWFYWRTSPHGRPHGSGHARMELRLIKEVVRRGWLTGTLKTPEKPKAAPPDKLTVMRAKLEHAKALRKGWETKKKRAETAITKYNRSIAQYERLLRSAT